MFEQHPRLDSRAGAESDQLRVGADRFRHLAPVVPQQLCLRARDVILGQLADFLEQLDAAFVVKKFAWERTRRGRKTGENFREEILIDRLEIEHSHHAGRTAHERSRASRMPLNCQRLSGGKKLR